MLRITQRNELLLELFWHQQGVGNARYFLGLTPVRLYIDELTLQCSFLRLFVADHLQRKALLIDEA